MAKLKEYMNASGTTFNHSNQKLSLREASGVVGEYNFTVNIRGDVLSFIQKTNPEVTDKVSLRKFVEAKIGYKAPKVAVTTEEVQKVVLPKIAVPDVAEVVLPPKAQPKKVMAYYTAMV